MPIAFIVAFIFFGGAIPAIVEAQPDAPAPQVQYEHHHASTAFPESVNGK